MPTYAYACTTCDHRFEVRQSFSDTAIRECPECTGAVRKLFNTVGIVFKGSGFYRTDSRSAPSKDKESSASTDSSSGGKDAAGKGDGGSSSSADSGSKAAKPAPKPAASKAPAGSSSAA